MIPLCIGFIGLGAIGAPMAQRLLAGGHQLTVCDVNPAAVSALVAQGARTAQTPAGVASAAEIVFASLPTPEICREVALGQDGVADGTSIKVYVETSTAGAATVQGIAARLAERGVGMLDSPVSGGAPGVRSGHLTCIVSGRSSALAQARPAFDTLTDQLFHVGQQPGLAQVVKLANQLLNITNLTVACEAMSMAIKAGLDPGVVLDVINASSGRNGATEGPLRDILARRFSGGARLAIMQKDIALAVAEADRLKTASFVGGIVRQIWTHAANDDDDQDFTNIYRYFEEWAGIALERVPAMTKSS
jgi:3-hydroxyisobutyrate dehydrogenase-like beta-hydroxyacid dehydrogenase